MHTELPSYNIRRALEPLLMKFGAKQPPFSDDCFLLQDLGIGGDDADEFLEAIHATFGTRFDGFAFATYFPDEHEAVGSIGSGDWGSRIHANLFGSGILWM